VELENEDGEKVVTKVAHKQLRYMPLTPRVKRLFLSRKTTMHMRWHKDCTDIQDGLMVHPSDGDAWKALDNFDLDFASDARNVRIGLATDGFTPYNKPIKKTKKGFKQREQKTTEVCPGLAHWTMSGAPGNPTPNLPPSGILGATPL
jgi:hypothetical protein